MLTATLLEIASRCATVPVENNMITMKHNRWTAYEFDNFINYETEEFFDLPEGPKELWKPHLRYFKSNFFYARYIED